MDSKQKGKRGELELAEYLRAQGFDQCRRGRQFSGLGAPDVVGIDTLHIECKRTETLRVHEALAQAVRESNGSIPVVMHRRSRGEWIAVLRLADLLRILRRD